MRRPVIALDSARPERPRLELSGPKLALAFEQLVARTDEQGGIEIYVDALKLKSAAFREALGGPQARTIELATLKKLCACIATVRRRAGRYFEPTTFPEFRGRLADLIETCGQTADIDARIAEFCATFPGDREHRWVRDLAGEVLHNIDPERYPLMTRWVWDARANTGVLREIWHAEDIDRIVIDVPDRYHTFLVLREELTDFLATNGVFRDTLHYVDLLTAQVYAGYISEQGGTYLRADFMTAEEPMLHTRRLLGLDGVAANGRTRLKSLDGTAYVVHDLALPH